ncbi:MAG: hypothetical protein QM772_15220 [Ottowia sp.]|uniref:hypothetical protein n=1 Tax=Ottowia sp. TaxID=1898956 RepID=UPI0039E3BC94
MPAAIYATGTFTLAVTLALGAAAHEKDMKPPEKRITITLEDYEKMEKQVQKERKAKRPPGDPCASNDKCRVINAPKPVVGGVRG